MYRPGRSSCTTSYSFNRRNARPVVTAVLDPSLLDRWRAAKIYSLMSF